MAKHVAADEPFERSELGAQEAIERFAAEDQPYKVELIQDLVRDEGVESVSLYRNGPFEDLCRGPHAPSTGRIGAFKLTSLAGAYWRGDENRQMLTRIYGTAFPDSKQDLAEHLERIEQAKARDHRRLGPELGLFTFREEAPGMPLWLPERRGAPAPDRGRGPQAAPPARLRGDQDAPDPRRGALASLRALGQLPREHVLRRAVRARSRRVGPPLRGQADELSRRLPRLRLGGALLPRPAAAPCRVRPRLALRARGRPARAAPGPRLHPGRRPRLLHDRSGSRRGRLDLRGDRPALRALRIRSGPGRALDPAREVDRHRRAVGARRQTRCARRSTARGASTT